LKSKFSNKNNKSQLKRTLNLEILHADEYIACLIADKKPDLAMVGTRIVTDGLLTETGRYLLVIDGLLFEVKSDFVIYAQWDSSTANSDPGQEN
jgi:hypothetical protein